MNLLGTRGRGFSPYRPELIALLLEHLWKLDAVRAASADALESEGPKIKLGFGGS